MLSGATRSSQFTKYFQGVFNDVVETSMTQADLWHIATGVRVVEGEYRNFSRPDYSIQRQVLGTSIADLNSKVNYIYQSKLQGGVPASIP